MNVREMDDRDISKLREWHAEQDWKYEFPDLSEEQFVVKRVIEEEDGTLVGAVIARKTVELYFLGERNWRTPLWRLMALTAMHEDVRQQLLARGYSDGHVWLPPEICKTFGRRLRRSFNWVRNTWPCYSRQTAE